MGARSPTAGQQVGNRVVEGILLAVLALVARAVSEVISQGPETGTSSSFIFQFGLSHFGFFAAIIGLAVVTWRAGLLGTVGFFLEMISTVNVDQGEVYIPFLFLGALLVVAGRYVWSWSWFLDEVIA